MKQAQHDEPLLNVILNYEVIMNTNKKTTEP
jgi:hypothetical protein